MKNQLPVAAAVRFPRGIIKINGAVLTGWTEVTWEENEFEQPDTFDATLAMNGLPPAMDVAWWAKTDKAEVEIYVGFPEDPLSYDEGELDLMFAGVVDDVAFDWDNLAMSLRGRDRTSVLVDHKTSEKYPNKTSSEVVTALASKYGLTPKVTATKTKIGRYYADDAVDLKASRTEWDLVTWLAKQEGFVAFVRGKELHFQKKDRDDQDPYVWEWAPATDDTPPSFNGELLKTSRVITIAKEVEVTVVTWDSKKKKHYKKTAKRTGGGSGDVQKYSFNVPGLTPEQAQELANKKRDEISRHTMQIEVSGPADNLLRIDDRMLLKGTETPFDQSYYPESISRTLMADAGYSWSVHGKNKFEETQDE